MSPIRGDLLVLAVAVQRRAQQTLTRVVTGATVV